MSGSRRGNLTLLPETREQLKNWVKLADTEGRNVDEARYCRARITSVAEAGTLEAAARREAHRLDLDNVVIKTWKTDDTKRPEVEKPVVEIRGRSVRMYSVTDRMAQKGKPEQETSNKLSLFIKNELGPNPPFIVVLPIFMEEPQKRESIVGLIISSDKVWMSMDLSHEGVVDVVKGYLENDELIKFILSGGQELEYYWTQLGIVPKQILCMTTASMRILDVFGINYQAHLKRTRQDRLALFPFNRYFQLNLRSASHDGADGVASSKYGPFVTEVLKLLAMIIKGIEYVPGYGGNQASWKMLFKWDRFETVRRLKEDGYLTDQLGINFYQAYSRAIKDRLHLEAFTMAFLYINFARNSPIESRDPTYQGAMLLYYSIADTLKDAEDEELDENINKVDDEKISTTRFKFLATNIIKNRVNIQRSTVVGTVGEMLRRIDLYAPALLNRMQDQVPVHYHEHELNNPDSD